MSAAALSPAPGLLASAAYAALLEGLDEAPLDAIEIEAFRAAADARLFDEPDVDARMLEVYGILYRRTGEAEGAELVALRRVRNQLFSIPRGVGRREAL